MAGKRDARNDATSFTKAANHAAKDRLPLGDDKGYQNAREGLIAQVEDLVIEGPNGPVWSLRAYLGQMPYPPPPDCPDTVNPSLWRMATLNSVAGLFRVVPGIYQVRAYDMSNMTIIEADTGLVIIDPLISTECARAALQLYRDNRPERADWPVKAVIYTHSHVDHFGGVAGIVDDPRSVQILAPAGFMEHAISENIYAGVAMSRRAQYMYGPYLKPGDKGQIDCGLGKGQSTGTISLLKPTTDITATGQSEKIDGLEIVFQMTPGSEAPAEMNFYFPRYKALCSAENTTHNMHNIQTLRGARVRDALLWSKYLNEAMYLFCDSTDVLFAQHHWPVWGKGDVQSFLSNQRDMYRYLNDQTLRLLNKGYTGIEIAENFELSPGLQRDWSCRGYYGSVSHNVKGVYDRYMGWFNGNPATLHALPPTKSSPRYVAAMGGAAVVIENARAAYNLGEYRWVAELVGHVIFDTKNVRPEELHAAKELQANALEQLGYQAEPATWRNFYLMGAQELRQGVTPEVPIFSPDISVQLTNEMIFDLLGSRLDGPNAARNRLVMSWHFTDMPSDDKQRLCMVEVSNGALSCTLGKYVPSSQADVVVELERSALDQVMIGEKTLEEVIAAGRIKVEKGLDELLWFFSLIEDGDPNFPIVTPKQLALPEMTPGPGAATAAVDTVKQRRWGFAPPVLKGC